MSVAAAAQPRCPSCGTTKFVVRFRAVAAVVVRGTRHGPRADWDVQVDENSVTRDSLVDTCCATCDLRLEDTAEAVTAALELDFRSASIRWGTGSPDGLPSKSDTSYCAWCEEAQSNVYLAHEGHDPECPFSR